MKRVLSIREPSEWEHSQVGGKGRALAEMSRIGLNVPEAFCVTVDAYKEFIEQPTAKRAIQMAHAELEDQHGAKELEITLNTLRTALLEVPVPDRIADEIKAAYFQLGMPKDDAEIPVAVRSSATAEDLPDASFAGQHDSFLFVRGGLAIVESVHKCWVSLWTARATKYRARHGIDHKKVSMAVVVQRMVNAEVSGVLFTINPLNGEHSQVVVNAVYGLGEALVSGEATPDHWILDKKTGRIMEATIANKETMAVAVNGAIMRSNVPAARRHEPALSTEQLLKLKDYGIRLEEHFGYAQDIEWAYESGVEYLLQSRPVTTQQQLDSSKNRFRIKSGSWTRMGLGEWLQQPLSPLFFSLVLPQFNSATDSFLEERFGVRRVSPTWLVLSGYYYIRCDIAFRIRLLLTPILLLRNMFRVPDEWDQKVVPNHIVEIQKLRDFNLVEASASETLDHFENATRVNARCWAWIVVTGAYAKITEVIFAHLYRFVMNERGMSYTSLLSGFPNRSVEADQELWELAELARAREDLRRAILGSSSSDVLKALARWEPDWFGRFQDWLDSYGHRVFDLDILHETMQDDPAIALKIIRNYIEHPTKSPASRQKLRTEERAAAVIVFQKALAKRFLTKGFIKKFLSLAQKYAAIRENRPFILHLGWPSMRKDVLALGRRLAASRVLNEPEEVFFLTAEELRSWSKRLADNNHSKDLGNEDQKVRERRREWESQKALVPPEHLNLNKLIRFILQFFSSNGSGVEKSSLVLTGIPASPGKAKGKTCTVGSQSDFGKLKSGNILIAKYTTPVWTPLLSLAAGVVTETGGALSHAAIIAREYGIPAVAGVAHATQIPDSTDVEVDGNVGHVYIRKGSPDQ